jgi:hypothetical protein
MDLSLTSTVSSWPHAEPWLRNAMDLSLLTLLRREDIACLEFSNVHDGALWVVPGKTEGTTGVRMKITLEGSLAEVVNRCRDNVLSPYLVHRMPERARGKEQRAKTRIHHTQVLPEKLTRAFAEVRDLVALERTDIDAKNPPTFHEIRSLGGALLRQAGWSVKQVQELMTYTSESMTAHYLGGHETPWTEVSIGISLKK